MSMEERGFYSECLDAMWELQGPLPKDGKRLALLLGCSPRTVAKLMPRMIAAGKIVETWYGYYNPRMMADLVEPVLPLDHGPAQRVSDAFRSASHRVRAEFDAKVPENPANTTREEESESEIDTPLCARRADDGGISIDEGRVTIAGPAAADLGAEFPTVDLAAVADLAGPELARFRAPSPADRLAVVRKWCRIAAERQARRLRPTASAEQPGADRETEVVPGWNRTLRMLQAREAKRLAEAAGANGGA